VTSLPMHPAYFETRFKLGLPAGDLPDDFAIVTAYQTAGKEWPIERNQEARKMLQAELEQGGVLVGTMTGYSPTDRPRRTRLCRPAVVRTGLRPGPPLRAGRGLLRQWRHALCQSLRPPPRPETRDSLVGPDGRCTFNPSGYGVEIS
jgi:hypothetical protein